MRYRRIMMGVLAPRQLGVAAVQWGKRVIAAAVVCGSVFLATSCGHDARPIRVMINPWPVYEFLYLAQQKGFFADEGVDVQLVELNALGDITSAYQRGQIDVVTCTLIEFLELRRLPGSACRVFSVLDFSNGGDAIVAKAPITGVADLRGKRVAVEPGSINLYVLARALEIAGLTFEDIELVETDPYRIQEVMDRAEADAVVSYPPFTVSLLKDKTLGVIFTSRQIPGEIVDLLCMAEELLADRGQDAAGIVRAFDRAVAYAAEHPEESYGIMAAREGIRPEDLRRVIEEDVHVVRLEEQARFLEAGGGLEQAIHRTVKIMRSAGQLGEAVDAAGCIDREPVTIALGR